MREDSPNELNASPPKLAERLAKLEKQMKTLEERLDALATKDDLDSGLKGLEQRLTGEIQGLDERLTGEIQDVTAEIHAAEDHLMEQLQIVNGKVDTSVPARTWRPWPEGSPPSQRMPRQTKSGGWLALS